MASGFQKKQARKGHNVGSNYTIEPKTFNELKMLWFRLHQKNWARHGALLAIDVHGSDSCWGIWGSDAWTTRSSEAALDQSSLWTKLGRTRVITSLVPFSSSLYTWPEQIQSKYSKSQVSNGIHSSEPPMHPRSNLAQWHSMRQKVNRNTCQCQDLIAHYEPKARR